MKLGSKLIFSYLMVATIASSATYLSVQSYKNIHSVFGRLMSDPVPAIKTLIELRNSSSRIVALTTKIELAYAESKTTNSSVQSGLIVNAEQELAASAEQYNDAEKAYEEILKSQDISKRKALPIIKLRGEELIKLSGQIIALKKRDASIAETLSKENDFEETRTLYVEATDEALAQAFRQLNDEQSSVQATIDESLRTTLIFYSLTFILAVILGLALSKSIARRIIKLQAASANIGHGELETVVIDNSRDEIGALTRSFNEMVDDLRISRTALLASNNFVNNVISSIADSLFILDLELNIVRVNQAAVELTGFAEDELLGKSIKILRPDGKFFDENDVAELQTKNCVSGVETFWLTKDQTEVPILFSASIIHDSDGTETGIVCVAQDITVRKSLEDQLSHQVLHDSLTGLANRVLFRIRVEHALTQTIRRNSSVAVLFLDLDDFKSVNDTLGHAAGDILLTAVGERLLACLRPSDTVARLGGDEFAVLIENVSHPDELNLIAERLNNVLRESFTIDGTEIFIQASIGIALNTDSQDGLEDLLRNADVAMYKAKGQGKNRHIFFKHAMREDLVKRVEFEADLRRAIEQQQFVLHYQPIMNLPSGHIIGMEALVRWQHPQLGLVPPDKFIPIAEETNLIVPLGKWVLEEACRQARKWQTQSDMLANLSVTVNLSTKQVQEENLVAMVSGALAHSGLPAGNLILEITESTMLQKTEATVKKLTELKNLGVRLAIDDFGTGYSSLSYLQRFPIDVLKIDKSFIDKISHGKEGAAVARAIITMSETLNLKTIAEGIETDGQNDILQSLGCNFGQGYYFAKPLSKDAMDEFLGGFVTGLNSSSDVWKNKNNQLAEKTV